MSFQIINDIASIKIVGANGEISIAKNTIKNIAIVRDSVIKIGRGDCMGSIYVRHTDISEPITANPNIFLSVINEMLAPYVEDVPGR